MSDENPTPSDGKPAPDDGQDAEQETREPAPVAVYSESDLLERVAAAEAAARERYLRLAAEYENFRRRVQKEREQWSADAVERFATDLIEVLDDLDRALAAKPGEGSAEDDDFLDGVRLTAKKLSVFLAKHGVECIDPAGVAFDPRLHEAVQRSPAAKGVAPGTVVAVLEKGYTLKGRLLRPARVMIAGDA